MALRGIKFGQFHTGEDWGLTMSEKNVAPPVPKTNYVSVPGRDGDLDLSEAVSGEVNYMDRAASFTFILTEGTHADRTELLTKIIGAIHGKKLEIYDEDDYPGYYMIGRLSVTETSLNGAYGVVKVAAVCQPWRYASAHKVERVTVNATSKTVRLCNDGYKTAAPVITVTGSVVITVGSTSYTLTTGSYILPGLRIPRGVTKVTVTGTGSVSFDFQEAIF